jgi:aromatic ring hydroxylase
MIRTGEQYRNSIRDDREVWINGERVKDVTRHPLFKPCVDNRARIYDMQHEAKTRDIMTKRRASAMPLATNCPTRKPTGPRSAKLLTP